MGKGGDASAIRRRSCDCGRGGLKRSASMLERLQLLADGMKHHERLRKMKVRMHWLGLSQALDQLAAAVTVCPRPDLPSIAPLCMRPASATAV